ncbi:Growth_factor receptor cysteine-rich domain superfamily [Hexamita inflata]|uniref:Growth factor receptor cysteine-rich domain superfamily n=1 Tax=Hexamita inflata TaxID=28002 RepID=A0AA86PMF6_9EUKA|nr:Growth factor receptor cysteine-rich domain superfamily [Hexamita inflata]
MGFVGVDPAKCQDCWGVSQVISNGTCKPCSSGAIYQTNDTCLCDVKRGFAGQNADQCVNCWNSYQVVNNFTCVDCQNFQPHSVFNAQSTICQCEAGYSLKHGQCRAKLSTGSVVVIWLSVILVVGIIVVTTIFVIRRKNGNKNVNIVQNGNVRDGNIIIHVNQ